jgi:hypothetical protein
LELWEFETLKITMATCQIFEDLLPFHVIHYFDLTHAQESVLYGQLRNEAVFFERITAFRVTANFAIDNVQFYLIV